MSYLVFLKYSNWKKHVMGKDLKATWFNCIWDSVWKFPLSTPTPQVSSLCLNNFHSKEPRKTFRGMCQDSRLRFVLCFNLSLASGKQPWVIAQLFSLRIIKPSQRAKGLCPSISGCSPIFLSLWLSQKLNRISFFLFWFSLCRFQGHLIFQSLS